MDRRERIANPLVSTDMKLKGWQTKIWTALPGILQSYDAGKNTCTVQASIQPQTRTPQGEWNNVTLPLMSDCPVVFPRGGGYGMTFPLASGDEGLIVFASRCIDGWWQNGGVQPQAEFRMHDLSDGFFIPGACSVPKVPENISTDAARMWSEDGALMVELNKTTGVLTLKAPTRVVIDAPEADFGSADIKTTGKINQGNIELGTHVHGSVQTGGDTSGPPQ